MHNVTIFQAVSIALLVVFASVGTGTFAWVMVSVTTWTSPYLERRARLAAVATGLLSFPVFLFLSLNLLGR